MLDLSVFAQKLTQVFELFQALLVNFQFGGDVIVFFSTV